LLAALVLPLAAVNVASPPQASATGGWPQLLDDVYAIDVATHPDGSVSVFSCGNGSNGAQSFDTSGNVTTTASQDYVFCDGWEGVAGADGTIFGTKYSSGGRVDIVAFQDDDELWSPVELTACTNEWAHSAGMVIGADGDLYVVAYAPDCSDEYYLLGIDAGDGSTKFKKELGTAEAASPGNRNGHVAAYDGGLIVRHGDATFRYFDYEGDEDTGKDFNLSLAGSEHVGRWAVNTDGTLFAMVIDTNWSRSGACTEPVILDRVYRRTLSGDGFDYELDDACTNAYYIHVTPSGGAVVPREPSYQISGSYNPDTSLFLLQPNGDIGGIVVAVTDGYDEWTGGSGATSVLVDTVGNLVYTRQIRSPWWPNEKFVQVSLRKPSGALIQDFNTPDQEYFTDNHAPAAGGTGIVNGSVYLAICEYTSCNSNPHKLYKLSFPKVGYEYPMGALLDLPAAPSMKRVDVLGDSFSSGEGVEPFIAGTDTAGPPVNRCHRSEKAYAILLDQDPDVPLYLRKFVACSGAMTNQITGTWPSNVPEPKNLNEPAQLDAITSGTDVVIISIGGNDIGFSAFAKHCLEQDGAEGCDENSDIYDETEGKILDTGTDGLGAKLQAVYSAIRTKAPNADVYVLGYPYVVPNLQSNFTSGGVCYFYYGLELVAQMSESSRAAATAITDLLNGKIEDVVDALEDDKFHYESPHQFFVNHQLCDTATGEDFFNEPMTPEVYSLHPNELGQEAFADLVHNAVTSS
jgi:lysophospholipase L1-like esterase